MATEPESGFAAWADTAAHLVDRVLPEVPVRQWVLTFPHSIRYCLAYDARLLRDVRRIFMRTVLSFYRRRALALCIDGGKSGAVVCVQRFGSALNLNVHFHALFLDGVYNVDEPWSIPRFHPLPELRDEDVAKLTRKLHRRIVRFVKRHYDPVEQEVPSSIDACYAGSIQGRVALGPKAGAYLERIGRDPNAQPDFEPGALCSNLEGFSLHAKVRIPARERTRLERLCRYVCRPPIAQDRLSLTELWAITSVGDLGVLDTASGVFQVRMQVGSLDWQARAWDPTSDRMYLSNWDTGRQVSRLYSMQLPSGMLTHIGDNGPGMLFSLDVDRLGNLWGVVDYTRLVAISRTSGSWVTTLVSPYSVCAISVHQATREVFATGNINNAGNALLVLDVGSRQVTVRGRLGGGTNVFALVDEHCPAGARSYGTSCSDGFGFAPALDMHGCFGEMGSVILSLAPIDHRALAVLLFGLVPTQVPFGNGCLIQIQPLFASPQLVIPVFGSGGGRERDRHPAALDSCWCNGQPIRRASLCDSSA